MLLMVAVEVVLEVPIDVALVVSVVLDARAGNLDGK
jgi:hypothetical protein